MSLKVMIREVDGVTVVGLDGKIMLGDATNSLREKMKSLLSDGKKKIVLDLGNVTMVDSAGLGTLVSFHHSAKTSGASLQLCNLGAKTRELLQMTRLLTVFEVSSSETEAISNISKR